MWIVMEGELGGGGSEGGLAAYSRDALAGWGWALHGYHPTRYVSLRNKESSLFYSNLLRIPQRLLLIQSQP